MKKRERAKLIKKMHLSVPIEDVKSTNTLPDIIQPFSKDSYTTRSETEDLTDDQLKETIFPPLSYL